MNKIILPLLTITFLASCSQAEPVVPKEPEKPCVHERLEIQSVNVLGKSGNDNSQALGAAGGMEIGAMAGCALGGPVGCFVGAALGVAVGVGAGTFDRSVDYEAHTASGTFVCQGKDCENLEEKKYVKEGSTLISTNCVTE